MGSWISSPFGVKAKIRSWYIAILRMLEQLLGARRMVEYLEQVVDPGMLGGRVRLSPSL